MTEFEKGEMGEILDGNYLMITRKGEIIFECTNAWHVPRVGEKIALAKWDNVYVVEEVFSVFGKASDVEVVTIRVKGV